MKTINIYITPDVKKKIEKVRAKYKVSLSTLVGIVSYELINALSHSNQVEKIQELQEKYLIKNGKQTSCKPRDVLKDYPNELINNKNCFCTNALYIYIEHQITTLINQEQANKYYAKIDKKLNEAYDIYWDYNCSIRNQRRMIRQNKEYWKKALEE